MVAFMHEIRGTNKICAYCLFIFQLVIIAPHINLIGFDIATVQICIFAHFWKTKHTCTHVKYVSETNEITHLQVEFGMCEYAGGETQGVEGLGVIFLWV